VLDPLGYLVDLPLEQVFHPLGFPARVAANSSLVLEAAGESWGRFEPLFDAPPLRLHVTVSAGGPDELPPPPVFRAQGHLLSVISDARNSAVCDLSQGFAYCWVTPAVAAASAWLRRRFLESTTYTMLTHRSVTAVHAACISRGGRGVLLCGPSGAGKSAFAFAAARNGWTFVTDDVSYMVRERADRVVLGKPQQIRFQESASTLFPELEGMSAMPDPRGQMLIEVDTADLEGMKTAARCNADYVVFLNRPVAGLPRLAPLDKDEAFARLLAEMPMYEPRIHEAHKASLALLLAAETYELRYSDLGPAIQALEELVGKCV